MKADYFYLVLPLLFTLSCGDLTELTAQDCPNLEIKWMDMEEATLRNKKNPRKFLIYVYSDNCGWCRKMESETFSAEPVIRHLNENFYAVKLNVNTRDEIRYGDRKFNYIPPNRKTGVPGHHEFIVLILQGRLAYPSYACLDENLVYLGINRGYKSIVSFTEWLLYIGEENFKTGAALDQPTRKPD